MNLQVFSEFLLYTLIYVAFAWGLKLILGLCARRVYEADDVIASGNLAVGLRHSGAQLGLAIALMGVMSGSTAADLIDDVMVTVAYGGLAMLFMLVSLLVCDKLILPGIRNTEALRDRNVAVGAVEFGLLTGTGIIAYASLVGEGGGALSSLIWFAVGQILLVVLVLAYEHLAHREFNILQAVAQGQAASGLYVGSKIIAYSLILKAAIASEGRAPDLVGQALEFTLFALGAMVLLGVFEWLVDLVIVTSVRVRDVLAGNRVSAALQLGIAKIAIALILSLAIL